MMQAGGCLRQDTETTLPELTEQHRIRQKEEELSGLESVHMAESETVWTIKGLNTLKPECVTERCGVSDVYHTHTSLIKTETDLGSTHTRDLIKRESFDSAELGYVTHLHPDQIKTEADDGGYLKAEHIYDLQDIKCVHPIKRESSESLPKQKSQYLEALEEIIGLSDEELPISEEDSEDSFDSIAEDMFIEGSDPIFDQSSSYGDTSDEDWEPEATPPQKKRARCSLPMGITSPATKSSIAAATTFSEPSPATESSTPAAATFFEPSPATESSTPTAAQSGHCRAKRAREKGNQSQHAASPSASEQRWHDVDEADVAPPQPVFKPARPPGSQLLSTSSYSPLQLFQLFFSPTMLQTILIHTNAYGAKCQEGKTKPRHYISMQDMHSYLALVIYMGLAKLSSLKDYWRKSRLYSLPLPTQIMSSRKFLYVSSALHLSDPKVDAENAKKRGTAAFDRLCEIKPLYEQIKEACKSHFHPAQNISIDERMVASKARIGLKQYMKNKPTKWGYKLFVLADSCSGYTWNFFVYEGKSFIEQGKGLSYDSVMALVDEKALGAGYKLFVDNFYTSPRLFRDLLQKKIWACGTIRLNRLGFPKTTINNFPTNAPRGSVRWIRENKLLFVKWKDTREVLMCSSIHKAYEGDTVQRRLKGDDGRWTTVDVPVPRAVKDYNRYMGGVDLSDALIGYYNVIHKTKKWYKTFFYHFVDIAVVNAFILHRAMAKIKNQKPQTQKEFREALVLQLADIGSPTATAPPLPPPTGYHKPKFIAGDSTAGRRKCRLCHQKTPMICISCEVPLCLKPKRDCFNSWHDQRNL